ncbi:MFS transporter [Calorimonas adulescens]|uniref:MFS transporter n=1 Tax=Calorimonas adulescens TaxID=2606906 RepID=A0A5D8Q9X3_9THEO|nr:MFS transporter [Calorimonas adulescens]TZE80919.1 MFS transporter [Calorimonas adulescens]
MHGTVRLIYLFLFMAFGSLSPLLNLYFSRIGFSGTEIGIIASGELMVSVLMQPVWGMISDRYRKRRHIFMVSAFTCSLIILANMRYKDFGHVFVIMGILSLFQCALVPVLDSSVMIELKGRGEEYGTFRLFGSLGYAVTSIAIGSLADRLTLEIIFIAYAVSMAITGVISFKLPEKYADDSGIVRSSPGSLFKNRNFSIFLIVAFMSQASMVVSENFLGVYIDYLKGSSSMVGLAWMLAALSEIPVFYFTGKLIKRYNLRKIIILALILVFLRVLLYGLSTTPLMVIVVHGISGLDYATFSAAAINFVSRHTPDSLKTSGQTVYTMVSTGLGGMVGNILGGTIMDKVGIRAMYLSFSMVILISLIVFILFVKDNSENVRGFNEV